MKHLRPTAVILATLIVAGCGGGASSTNLPTEPAATPTPPATTAPATPSPSVEARLTVTAAQIDVDGRTRDYLVVMPPNAVGPHLLARGGIPGGGPMPLLLVLHGAEQSMRVAETYGFDMAATGSGALVVYPQGEKDPDQPGRPGYIWNAGATDTGFDDVAFVSALIGALEGDFEIDSNAVFILGASNGGQMAYRAACALSDHIAAVGDISGALLVKCHPSSPVSVIDVHGMADTMTPPDGGGEGCLPLQCPPLDVTQETWRQADGCTGDPTVTTIAPGSVETEWAACKDGTAVAFIRADGVNHFMEGIQFNVAAVMWAFLEDHGRGGSTP